MKTYYNGFETNEATFKASVDIPAGRAVALGSGGNVYYPTNPPLFTGIVSCCKDGYASVVIRGYVVARYKDTMPIVGICKLAPTADGYMEVNETDGKPYTVVGVNSTKGTIEIIL